jgi:hypothetical protein
MRVMTFKSRSAQAGVNMSGRCVAPAGIARTSDTHSVCNRRIPVFIAASLLRASGALPRPHERPGAHLVESGQDCLDGSDKGLDRSELAKKAEFPENGLNLPASCGD